MRIFWANCKLVLLRGMTFLAVFLVMLWAMVAYGQLDMTGFLVILLVMNRPFSSVHRHVAARPSSFCWPGYRNALRMMMLTDAVLGGLACSVAAVLWQHEGVWPLVVLYAGTGFFVGSAVTLLAAVVELAPFVMTPALDVVLSIPFGVTLVLVLGAAIVCPWIIWPVAVLVCMGISVFVWCRLCDASDVIQAHRMIVESAVIKRAWAQTKKAAPLWLESLFLAWARRFSALGVRRYLWASSYQAFGTLFSYWIWALAGVVATSFILIKPVAEIAFASLGLLAVFIDLPATSSMLLPGGRRERYWATVVVALATSLLFLGLATATAALSELIAASLGYGTLRLGFRFSSVGLAATLVPWACALKLGGFAFQKGDEKAAPFFVGFILLMVAHHFLLEGQYFAIFLGIIGPCGWVFFLLVLRYVCTKGCLVRQRVQTGALSCPS